MYIYFPPAVSTAGFFCTFVEMSSTKSAEQIYDEMIIEMIDCLIMEAPYNGGLLFRPQDLPKINEIAKSYRDKFEKGSDFHNTLYPVGGVDGDPSYFEKLKSTIVHLGYFSFDSYNKIALSDLGRRVRDVGGHSKYVESLNIESQLKRQLYDLNEANIKGAKLQRIATKITITSAIVTMLSMGVTMFDVCYDKTAVELKKIRESIEMKSTIRDVFYISENPPKVNKLDTIVPLKTPKSISSKSPRR